MLDLGLLGLANPWLLTALISLPVLWWLLRIIPPAPLRVRFPAIRFLLGLEPEEETSARTPLWLLLLRLGIAALLILALAGPVLNPEPELSGQGPLVLVVDDGWAAAPGWPQRIQALERFTARAQRQNREVVLLGTAPNPGAPTLRRLSAAEAVQSVTAWQPKPWPLARMVALGQLLEEPLEGAEVIWLSDGVASDPAAREAARDFAAELRRIGPLQTFAEPPEQRAMLLLTPTLGEDALVVAARRPSGGELETADVRALGPGGEVVGQARLVFEPGAARAEAALELPLDLRNRIARLELQPRAAVGGVVLLDERWRRRVIGLVGATSGRAAQPLLSELYYIERALSPHAELRTGSVAELLDGGLSMLVLADGAEIGPEARLQLDAWIGEGGVLLRFAGPRLANAEDDLVPVGLRRGDRNLGGALSWSQPLPLGEFPDPGPLAGLPVAEGDVVVRRQVLAQPGPDLAAHTWARLADGTPLITGEQRGAGWLVLVHTTANPSWSTLPLSGVFVDVLRRIAALARGAGGSHQGLLTPIEVLDANGHLAPPSPAVQPIPATDFAAAIASPIHPPGLYGPLEAGDQVARQALNLASAVPELQALTAADFAVRPRGYEGSGEIDLLPWLLLAALLLVLIDTLIGLHLRGLGWVRARATPAVFMTPLVLGGLVLGGLALGWAGPVVAADEPVIEATSATRLAYVLTGQAEVDEASRAGLEGLSLVLNRRTAVEAGTPQAVELAVDDLNLFPLLYWPVSADHPGLGAGVAERLDAYLRQGGMILFDTGDAGQMIPGQAGPGQGERRLAQLLAGLNLPPLEPVPQDHTLTRSFYLLQDFPGRWTGRTLWVERAEPGINDGVSSVIIGSHGWAEAWAIDAYGLSIYPVLPGGERQREMARRFGVNLVMYALTGNYKTDQVHVPALLERLGQ